jgi:hypothetical protein
MVGLVYFVGRPLLDSWDRGVAVDAERTEFVKLKNQLERETAEIDVIQTKRAGERSAYKEHANHRDQHVLRQQILRDRHPEWK